MSKVTRPDGEKRPTWRYPTAEMQSMACSQLEMLESCRNVMEEVRDQMKLLNQLLHCSNFMNIPDTLQQIRRNTRKPKARRGLPVHRLRGK